MVICATTGVDQARVAELGEMAGNHLAHAADAVGERLVRGPDHQPSRWVDGIGQVEHGPHEAPAHRPEARVRQCLDDIKEAPAHLLCQRPRERRVRAPPISAMRSIGSSRTSQSVTAWTLSGAASPVGR